MNLINTHDQQHLHKTAMNWASCRPLEVSCRQLTRMMQTEGLFYSLFTLILSLGLGSLVGYGAFLYARADRNDEHYNIPLPTPARPSFWQLPSRVIQLILSFAVSRSFRKMSLIDRVRYSE